MKEEIETKILYPEDYGKWDSFVEESSLGSIFNSSLWLKTISMDVNKFVLYGVFQKDVLIGGCCLFERKKSTFKYGYSPLFGTATPYGSLIISDKKTKEISEVESTRKSVIKSLSDYFLESFDRISLINSPGFDDIRQFTWSGWKTDVRYTYLIRLDNDLWYRVSHDCRKVVRRAIKNSIEIKTSSNIDEFYKLFEQMYYHQNLPVPVPKILINNIFNIFSKKNQCKLWIAKTDTGELAAAAMPVWDKKKGYGWISASNPEIRETGASSLLYWSTFEELSKELDAFDLCGANTPNIAKFKSSFNPELLPYYKVDYVSPTMNLFLKIKNLIKK